MKQLKETTVVNALVDAISRETDAERKSQLAQAAVEATEKEREAIRAELKKEGGKK